MTDLENAGANVYYEIARKVVAASKNTSGEDVVDATTIIRTEMDAARAAGRIEGLEEELALHRESARYHLSEYRRHSRGRLGGAEEPEVHRALASHYMYHARRIRARIQELEDEK